MIDFLQTNFAILKTNQTRQGVVQKNHGELHLPWSNNTKGNNASDKLISSKNYISATFLYHFFTPFIGLAHITQK